MKKILYCASTDSHILNFHIPYLKALRESGYEVWVAANGKSDIPFANEIVRTNFKKNLFSLRNITEAISIYKIISAEHFDVIHTHTTLAAAVVRLAALVRGKGTTKLISTTHGYFFWRGASLLKWLIYFSVEFICRYVTDSVVTMNKEDYYLAQKYHLSKGLVYKIKGMGIDSEKFKPFREEEKDLQRSLMGFDKEEFLLIYSAEFSKRKNHKELFMAVNLIKDRIPKLRLLCAGHGALYDELHDFVNKNDLNSYIKFLGYVNNLEKYYPMCDLIVSSSTCEGLPFNIMEGMACGIPPVASLIKGHEDLIIDGENELLYKPSDYRQLADAIFKLYNDENLRHKFGLKSREFIQQYTINNILEENMGIYQKVCNTWALQILVC